MPKTLRRALIGCSLASLLVMAAAGGWWWGEAREDAYAFTGGEIDPAKPAPPLALTDQHGQPFDLSAAKGDAVLLFFGYTSCPDVCPTTLSDFSAIKADLGEDAERVRFVFVTVDPERDTPARVGEYLAAFDPAFVGLTGTPDQITQAKAGYGVVSPKADTWSATGYLLDHSSLTYAIDRQGRWRLTYGYGTDPAAIADDMRHLLDT
jgi:protein SCO1/2